MPALGVCRQLMETAPRVTQAAESAGCHGARDCGPVWACAVAALRLLSLETFTHAGDYPCQRPIKDNRRTSLRMHFTHKTISHIIPKC